jgi:hypothetical protein
MSFACFHTDSAVSIPTRKQRTPRAFTRAMMPIVAMSVLGAIAVPASADSVSNNVDVPASPAAVWSMIGPFCAIKDWLPPVGSCVEDGNVKPTRTLVTKDGAATFVELQTARSDAEHFYSYTFLSSPLPVTHYTSTIRVAARNGGGSTVSWTGTYIPVQGKEKEANEALTGIYKVGLDQIRAKFAER